jgi:hypothetical protein
MSSGTIFRVGFSRRFAKQDSCRKKAILSGSVFHGILMGGGLHGVFFSGAADAGKTAAKFSSKYHKISVCSKKKQGRA